MINYITGDWGSGKTNIAWIVAQQALYEGQRVLWVGPTDYLAKAVGIGFDIDTPEINVRGRYWDLIVLDDVDDYYVSKFSVRLSPGGRMIITKRT